MQVVIRRQPANIEPSSAALTLPAHNVVAAFREPAVAMFMSQNPASIGCGLKDKTQVMRARLWATTDRAEENRAILWADMVRRESDAFEPRLNDLTLRLWLKSELKSVWYARHCVSPPYQVIRHCPGCSQQRGAFCTFSIGWSAASEVRSRSFHLRTTSDNPVLLFDEHNDVVRHRQLSSVRL
jgi:hypothetical protein